MIVNPQGQLTIRDGWKGERGTVRLAAAGDVMLGLHTAEACQKKGMKWPFELIRKDFQDADVRLANVECTISDTGEFKPFSGKSLRAPSSMIDALKDLQLNIATLANNHVMDEGVEALEATIRHLNAAKIQTFGAGMNLEDAWRPAVMEVNGMKIGFLGCVDFENTTYAAKANEPGVADYRSGTIFKSIEKLRSSVDHIVINIHADWEFYPYPSPERVAYGRKLVEAGAKIVLMHHPHVPQGLERWKDGVIVYSLGNFMFPAADSYIKQGSPWTDRSYYVLIDLDKTGPLGLTLKPFKTLPEARNVPLEQQEFAAFMGHIQEISQKLNDQDFIERYAHTVWFHQLWVYMYVANKTAREGKNQRKVNALAQSVVDKSLYPEKRPLFEERLKKFGPPDLSMIDPQLWLDP
jgi:hypothetical protein